MSDSQLRNVQFRVHRYFFERESLWYRKKLSAPASPGAAKSGSSDNEPIVFTDVSPDDFEKLLWVFYNPRFSLYPAPASTWTSILALAHRWGFAEVKAFCVRELEKKSIEELGGIDRIVVYHANEVDRNLLIPVYAALCARENPLTLPEGLKLGMETTLIIASAREYVRSHVMEDGSRTPITPTAQGEEMEQIIRDFFGIPIPDGSSASADEVLAAAAMADPVEPEEEQPKQAQQEKPNLKVKPSKKDKDDSSGAPVTSFSLP
jgi:BTB/POZ domain